jgi:AcrR family transcriptional regulator
MKLTVVCFYRHSSINPLKSLSTIAQSGSNQARFLSRPIASMTEAGEIYSDAAAESKTGIKMRKPGSNGAETLRNVRTAAIQLLSEHGYEGMNLRMLARKVGIQASSLYNYIDSKQQLLFWLLEETTESLLVEFDQRLKGVENPADRLRKFVEVHLTYHIANRKQASALQMEMRSLTAKNHQAILKLQRLYTEKVRSIVDHGVEVGSFHVADSEIATFAFLQMLTAVIRWYQPQGRLTLEQLVDIYTDLSFGMLHADQDASGRQGVAKSGPTPRKSRSVAASAVRRPRPVEPAEPILSADS